MSRNTKHSSREYGGWTYGGGYLYSNHAHYDACVQTYAYSGETYHYFSYKCGSSPYEPNLPVGWAQSQGLAWRYGGGCGFIWGREQATKLHDSHHLYGLC